MNGKHRGKLIRGGALTLALIACACPAFAQISVFAANEVRAAGIKDRLHGVRFTLKDGADGARKHSKAVAEAFQDTDDWAHATEAYYARKTELVARAAKLENTLDALVSRNVPERAEEVTEALDALVKGADTLRSDYEFYMKLPVLADGPQRQAAQAAMRLLGQTGDYPVTFAYFLSKTPKRPPYAPLPPGVMSIRHQ